jgi:uncharacterized membrane protein
MQMLHVALPLVAALGCGLMAGIFFAFSAFVMTALGRLPSAAGIAAMRSINVAIMNPLFLVVFFGPAALSRVAAVAAIVAWPVPAALYLFAGGVLYLLGGLVVTMQRNVPLNQALAAADPASDEGALLWYRYLSVWTAWNHVRTVAALAATAAFIMALRQG